MVVLRGGKKGHKRLSNRWCLFLWNGGQDLFQLLHIVVRAVKNVIDASVLPGEAH